MSDRPMGGLLISYWLDPQVENGPTFMWALPNILLSWLDRYALSVCLFM